jgi:DNA processing protein
MNNDEIVLHLSLIDGIGPSTVLQLIKNKPWDIDLIDLYGMVPADVANIFGISLNKARAIVSGLADMSRIDCELELIARHRVSWTTVFNTRYPDLLKHIHLPPVILYWQGVLRADCARNLAIVGSRNANYYGISIVESFVPSLVNMGWSVVSGGALGADAAAHRVAMNSGGYTIAVFGSGLLNPYPVRNKRLFEDILDKQGALLSFFPLTTGVDAGNFPARNRVIAGMSVGCLVVQAADKSGALITARYALDAGRELFAVPGPIDDPLSAGCHELIRQGAKLVGSVGDIVEEFGQEVCRKPQQQQISWCEDAVHGAGSFKAEGHKATIMRCCVKPCCVDELADQTGLAIHDLYTLLFELELDGSVCQQTNGTWSLRMK